MKKNKNQTHKPILNERIRSKTVRIVTENNSTILPLLEAINLAKSKGLDLILITPKANPPVCKITDVGKYLYQLNKNLKNNSTVKEKEVHFTVTIAEHDFNTKINHTKDFLSKHMNVKVIVILEGRENSHPELAYNLMQRITLELDEVAKYDSKFKLISNKIQVHFTPKKNGH